MIDVRITVSCRVFFFGSLVTDWKDKGHKFIILPMATSPHCDGLCDGAIKFNVVSLVEEYPNAVETSDSTGT